MKITDDSIMKGLLLADILLNLNPDNIHDVREICEQCVYELYKEKL